MAHEWFFHQQSNLLGLELNMVQFPPKRRGRPPGKVYDFNVNLPLAREMVRLIEGALKPKQSRCEFIRRATARAISPDEEPRRAEVNRRKGIAGETSPSAILPPLGRE